MAEVVPSVKNQEKGHIGNYEIVNEIMRQNLHNVVFFNQKTKNNSGWGIFHALASGFVF